jgi:hypothetical protein
MRRTVHSALIGGTVLLAASGFALAQAPPAPGLVHVRCRISVPSGVTEPLTMAAQIYRVGRDNLGKYQLQGDAQNLIVNLTPGAGGTGAGVFDTDLSLGNDVEYEFKVVPLDKDGNERTDGRYYFVSPDVAGDIFDKTFTLRPGEVNEIVVNLRWITRAQQYKSNFMQVVPRPGRTDYFLALYINDSTDINLMN